jgi:Na+-transporting NADH:ubiquinone oxidoreductase subunit B
VLRRVFESVEPAFSDGGRLSYFHPLYEAIDTFVFTTDRQTSGAPHVRDGMDLKRVMIVVYVALVPCIWMAMWNTGFQANQALATMGLDVVPGWRGDAMRWLGLTPDPASLWANVAHGALYFLPLYLVTLVAGGVWEALFAMVRRHEIAEGFLVTSILFPLILPPTLPLWQAALGISFGVVIGKELFGGVGRNILNPALTGRAFLFFAYPMRMTGDSIWTAVDGYSGATPLGAMAVATPGEALSAIDVTWQQAFLGVMPGSMGETSVLACLIGAAVLIITGVGSWRVMLSMLVGGAGCAALLQAVGSDTNPMFAVPVYWHLISGGFAFGLVFMATDPVSAAQTNLGRWIYGFFVGVVSIVIRSANPAYPEGVMLAILLGNVFAPLIDWFVVQANVRRRALRHG